MMGRMDVDRHSVGPDATIRDAVARMDANRRGIMLVLDRERRLLGTISDGDIRRAILARANLGAPVTELLARKSGSQYAAPTTASIRADQNACLALFKQHSVTHIPLLDDEGRVAGLVGYDAFVPGAVLPLQAVIMAGGAGLRLHPLTEDMPKPMLPVGDRPLMEIIIEQLREVGIHRVNVTTHHQPDKISRHFGDGRKFGIELTYVAEERPLGTAGSLGLMKPPEETTLVINGDILTRVDFRAMLAYHREHQADLTMAVRPYDVEVPYGVVECEGQLVRKISEKPVLGFFINAGIYLLEPAVYRFIPNGQQFDMTDLVQRLVDERRPVISFPIREYWLDIGGHAQYEQAKAAIKQWAVE